MGNSGDRFRVYSSDDENSCDHSKRGQAKASSFNGGEVEGRASRKYLLVRGVAEVMDVSHILVGALTAVALAWLVWAEIGSRRNSAHRGEDPMKAASAERNASSQGSSQSVR